MISERAPRGGTGISGCLPGSSWTRRRAPLRLSAATHSPTSPSVSYRTLAGALRPRRVHKFPPLRPSARSVQQSRSMSQTVVPITLCRYLVDYKYAGLNHWGLHQGCSFQEVRRSVGSEGEAAALREYSCPRDPPAALPLSAVAPAAAVAAPDRTAETTTEELQPFAVASRAMLSTSDVRGFQAAAQTRTRRLHDAAVAGQAARDEARVRRGRSSRAPPPRAAASDVPAGESQSTPPSGAAAANGGAAPVGTGSTEDAEVGSIASAAASEDDSDNSLHGEQSAAAAAERGASLVPEAETDVAGAPSGVVIDGRSAATEAFAAVTAGFVAGDDQGPATDPQGDRTGSQAPSGSDQPGDTPSLQADIMAQPTPSESDLPADAALADEEAGVVHRLRCSVDRASRGVCVTSAGHDGFRHVAVRLAPIAPARFGDRPTLHRTTLMQESANGQYAQHCLGVRNRGDRAGALFGWLVRSGQ